MKLKNQVVSLELAQKLKELGVKQESLFWWHYGCSTWATPHIKTEADSCIGKTLSAFTVAELGEMLPYAINGLNDTGYYLACDKAREWWNVSYDDIKENHYTMMTADTEADARAKMLIYLIENALLPTHPTSEISD